MSGDDDARGNARMTRLLSEWGANARREGERLFAPPADLPSLRAAQDEVDAECARGAASRAPRRRIPAIAVAAVLLLAGAAGLVVILTNDAPVVAPLSIRGLEAVVVPAGGGVTRSEPAADFKTGDLLELRFRSDGPGVVHVAHVDPSGRLTPLLPAPQTFIAGAASVGFFRLEGEPGAETFIVLLGPPDATAGEFDRALAEAGTEAANGVEALLERIRAGGRLAAEALAVRHSPR